jgi:hypothetical protein
VAHRIPAEHAPSRDPMGFSYSHVHTDSLNFLLASIQS